MLKISFKQGTILIKGNIRVPNSVWDERSGSFRAPAMYYKNIINYLEESGIDFEDSVLDLLLCPDLELLVSVKRNDGLQLLLQTPRFSTAEDSDLLQHPSVGDTGQAIGLDQLDVQFGVVPDGELLYPPVRPLSLLPELHSGQGIPAIGR